MELNRAKQIISSSAEIDVSYHGLSVWIEKIHEDGKIASVHLLNSPEEISDVDISELNEH